MVVTTVYVIATMSFSGILEPGLVPALIPIGLLSGLSAVVTLLLIVAVANNKIQGMAMVRALGHADRRAAVPAVVHRLGLEPGVRCVAAILGGQGVLGRQRPRHVVAVCRCAASCTTWPSRGRCSGASSPSTRDDLPGGDTCIGTS